MIDYQKKYAVVGRWAFGGVLFAMYWTGQNGVSWWTGSGWPAAVALVVIAVGTMPGLAWLVYWPKVDEPEEK